MTLDEFVTNLMDEVQPWLDARHNGISGPWITFAEDMSRLYLFGTCDSTARWSIDLNLCISIIDTKNAITLNEMIHGIILCFEARIDKNQRWSL